jgi:hypothetical protein
MKKISLLLLAGIFSVGCQERKESYYPTCQDAMNAGLKEPVWLPDFVPENAADIIETHDVDSSHLALTFVASNADFLRKDYRLPKGLRPRAKKIIDAVDFPRHAPTEAKDYFYFCLNDGVGLLAEDLQGSRFFYFEPIRDREWKNIC